MNKLFKLALIVAVLTSLMLAGVALAQEAAKVYTPEEISKEAMAQTTNVDVATAKAGIDEGKFKVILDVREPKEYKKGHIPGAIVIPRGVLEFKVAEQIADKTTTILIYCKKGGRGALSAVQLKKLGYTAVTNVKGGWLAWEKAGYPVE